jgi:NSS family neurotransmitter:Na+ symporter
MPDNVLQRETWGGKLGFFLAATGSAIGLGNVWRFPMIAGENGGAAFVLIYLAAVVLIGMPVMLAELALGWQTRLSPVRAFEKLYPGTPWKVTGVVAVFASLAIVSYYSVVASWTTVYGLFSISGRFNEIPDAEYLGEQFEGLTGNGIFVIAALAGFVAVTTMVVMGGVKKGIERWSKILMPLLLLILVLLLVRSVTLPRAAEGLRFYLSPDFSKVSPRTVLDALSQAFFSLSLGMGIMITYGSYLSKEANLVPFTCEICLADTAIAVLVGLIIFPALFTIPGLEPTVGPKLIFLVLPNIFGQIPGGTLFAIGFFSVLTLAALTSAVSLLEVVASYCIDTWNWSRKKSVLASGLAIFVLGLPSALGNGAVQTLSELPLVGISFLDLMDLVFGKLCLALTDLCSACLWDGAGVLPRLWLVHANRYGWSSPGGG